MIFERVVALGLVPALWFGLALSALAQEAAAPEAEPVVEPLTENAGAYLAARQASATNDYLASQDWYAQALETAPGDAQLLQGLLVAKLALGDFEGAADIATSLSVLDNTVHSVGLNLITLRAGSADYAGVLDQLSQGRSAGAVLDDLIAGWAEQGQGRMTEALVRFDKAVAAAGFEGLGSYHKALALAAAGDLEGADKILSGPSGKSILGFRRGLVAHMQILSQLERNADALALFDQSFTGVLDGDLVDLRRRLSAGEPIDFDVVTSAKDGIAEALFTFASVIEDQADPDVVLIYARAALYLRPDLTEVKLTVAEQLVALEQFDLAAQAFAQITAEDAAYPAAEIGRADAMSKGGNLDGAIEVLQGLAQTHGQLVQVQLALGDRLQRAERFAEAIVAFDAGIALVDDPAPWSWPLHFNRGVCLERLGRFDEGVASFRKALELAPNQPQVLNYLGYTWIDRGENLAEALTLIEQAVKLAPDQGYIIDSLAWAYFRLGRYADALEPMERASLLEPVDPVVTDHLGDVYWVNGRQLEARFQWRRAQSFEPTEKDAERIRLKLEKGLDAVMELEKAGQ